ncbi:magnesium protoporphyrin IX methyltransferase [uncultured Alsobacter sp.]|uniref:magnesium protoporphyrin IX methyltransferase n=1 Tax=uncultured Alsobacter sp. TaxID=1748258 RepID=UPI0025EACC6F|nr:magnesium protoporphyrin IX methyltransferase [uncultured Alsobacter sp.]
MPTATYSRRRGQLETYFDRTAVDAWKRLTSDAPVGRIRATVRAGRDRMRGTLLDWLPADLHGRRILDAGCGTGALAVEAARRGAHVVAIDLSPTLVGLARDRAQDDPATRTIDFRVGDMFDQALGEFDHVVAMDSLIHYKATDVVRVLDGFARRSRHSMLFTFAPRSPALMLFWLAGKAFPRSDRSPAIEPIAEDALRRAIARDPGLAAWGCGRTLRVASGFYTSQAMELVHR